MVSHVPATASASFLADMERAQDAGAGPGSPVSHRLASRKLKEKKKLNFVHPA